MKPQPYTIETADNIAIIVFREVSKFSRDELAQLIERELASNEVAHCQHVLVDCQSLAYANSLFLELLIRIARQTSQQSGNFAICAPNEFIQELLKVTNLYDHWQIYPTRAEALQQLQE